MGVVTASIYSLILLYYALLMLLKSMNLFEHEPKSHSLKALSSPTNTFSIFTSWW